jgi:hypothetical protein
MMVVDKRSRNYAKYIADRMAIMAGLTLSLFISITKNIFCLAVFLLYFFDGSCFLDRAAAAK